MAPSFPLAITAASAVSALGSGRAAHLAALRAGRGGLVPDPAGGAGWIGPVGAVDDHRLPPALARFECRNNRLADLALHADGFAAAVAGARDRYGADRIALVLGTSTSGVAAAEAAYADRGGDGALPAWFDYDGTQDVFSLGAYVRAALGLRGPAHVVSVACASSARACLDAALLIAADVCDAAVVGGADSLCRMTLEGFAALELIAPGPCRPCAADRAGISIGEGAGFALLERPGAAPAGTPLLTGVGASSDAHHMSQPHPEGAGAIAAMRGALAMAGAAPDTVDWIALHGTGTRANDATEDAAVTAVFGPGQPCASLKGYTGHTLGACGILNLVAAMDCMAAGFLPGCRGLDAADPAFRADVLLAARAAAPRRVLSNSFGFGGINCSLVLERGT